MISFLDLISAIGGLGGLSLIICLAYWLGKKFTEIDERFKQIDEGFKQIDERFKQIDERFDGLRSYVDGRFDELGRRIERIGSAFMNYQEFFVEFLAHEGVIRSGSKELLVGEARRVVGMAMLNPLTKEDFKKIEEYIEKSEKDTITLKEAEEFRDLARRVVMEYGEHPEAWKLHIYATITLALIRKKNLEKK